MGLALPGMAAKSSIETLVHRNIGTNGMKLDSSIAAVVTGGASGLGEGTARSIAATGAKVALFDLNEERGEEVAKEIGGVFCKVDVTDDASVAAAFEKARAAHGQERLTVNCAGIATGMKTVSRKKDTGEIKAHDMAQFERTVRVNLFGTFRVLSQSAAGMVTLEPMADGERGLIVNTASVAAQDGQIGQAAYSASKGGVYAMTLPVAPRPGPRGRPLQHHPARHHVDADDGRHGPEDPGRPGRRHPLPQPSGHARRLCVPGAGAGPQRLYQRRMHPPGRGDPAGAALTRGRAPRARRGPAFAGMTRLAA
jgi:NAD(P)-dependent dehydrogenase (short-subunit alcohol dehydrogenase family)